MALANDVLNLQVGITLQYILVDTEDPSPKLLAW